MFDYLIMLINAAIALIAFTIFKDFASWIVSFIMIMFVFGWAIAKANLEILEQ